jgi:hypothetical protein
MTGGVHATILLTVTETELKSRAGLATTGHGAIISVEQALQICTDLEVIPIIFNDANAVTYFGTGYRLATPAQRMALAARDKGCCFPGCDRPPAWCEAHHVDEYRNGRPTSLWNLALLCGYHHREFQNLGWIVHMINGIPMWTPPTWIDPLRIPVRNTAHI